MAVGDEAADSIDQEVEWAAMAGVLDLTDILELIVSDRLGSSRIVSMSAHVRRSSVSDRGIKRVRLVLRRRVMSWTPCSTRRCSASGCATRARSAKQLAQEAVDPLEQRGNGLAVSDVATGEAQGP